MPKLEKFKCDILSDFHQMWLYLNSIFWPFSGFCNATWDGFLCWPLTPAGQVASQVCPENVKGILRGRKFNTLKASLMPTVVENHRKSLIQHCERSEKCLQFESTKVHQKCQKWSILAIFRKPENATFLVIFNHCGCRSVQKPFWKHTLLMRVVEIIQIPIAL